MFQIINVHIALKTAYTSIEYSVKLFLVKSITSIFYHIKKHLVLYRPHVEVNR